MPASFPENLRNARLFNAPASRLKKSCRGVKSNFLSFPFLSLVRQPQPLLPQGTRFLVTVGLHFGTYIVAPRLAFSSIRHLDELHQLLSERLFYAAPAASQIASSLVGIRIHSHKPNLLRLFDHAFFQPLNRFFKPSTVF